MAKAQKEQPEDLPGLKELLEGPKEKPTPQPQGRPAVTDEEPEAPLPKPGEAPRPEPVKVRAKAGSAPSEKGTMTPVKKSKTASGPGHIKDKLWFLFPPDPVDQKRRNLRLLGLVKYLILPIIVMTVAALLVVYIWWYFWSYGDTVALYSRSVPTLLFLIPLGLGFFVAIYLPLNMLVLNRFEAKFNRELGAKLREKLPEGPKAGPKAKAPPKKQQAPEAPLPQPTISR